MNYKKYTVLIALFLMVLSMSCRDESLYPLPYNDRTTGAYLRMYKITSNVFDLNDLNNSGFETIYEAVDEAYGNNLSTVEFYVSHRRGTALTSEVFIKTIDGSDFSNVPEPTYSEYKRALIRLTANETFAALNTLSADPDGTGPLVAFPGAFAAADEVIYRWVLVLKDGRRFSVLNPQRTNISEANNTPNITTGQFYSAPSTFTITVRSLAAASWVGTYSLVQTSIWSPAHSVALHASSFPTWMNQVLFPNQTVTLSIPAGGLSTEREFQVQYRGASTTMRLNLENGTVWVPLQNSTVDCSPERELYWVTPTTGSFTPGTTVLPAGLPQVTTTNRGSYSTGISGLTAGDVITIGVDDDCDEYGRRSGYCSWTRRIRLTLTKL